ncbi:MAG TPA: phosphotransferase [Ktedonobacteraceae bacterium]|jgi:aminoglycoside phosphotransferase (APT) family kinase protein
MQQATREEEVRQLLLSGYTRAFPRRAHARITSCQNINAGWESELLCVRLHYEEEGHAQEEEIILKLYAGEPGPRKAQREFRALKWLEGAGYPVPHVLFASLHETEPVRAYVAMEKIAGETVARLLEAGSEEQGRALLNRCCRLYADLHTLALEQTPGAREERSDAVRAWLMHVSVICEQQLPGVFEPLLDWLQEQPVSCSRICRIHGDFHFDNVMLREDGGLVVIDWTGSRLSDPRFDLGWTLLLLRTQGRAALVNPLLAEYERQVGRPVEHLAFFEAAACWRRLFDLLFSARKGAAALGMKPDLTEQIGRQGAHVQAVYTRLHECTGCILPGIEAFSAALNASRPCGWPAVTEERGVV